MKWRLVEDRMHSNMFGVDIEIDERALLLALSNYIGSLKDRYVPDRDVISCKLIPDAATFKIEKKEEKPWTP